MAGAAGSIVEQVVAAAGEAATQEPLGAFDPAMLAATLAVALLLSVLLVPLVSVGVQWRYRRAVRRSMQRRAVPPPPRPGSRVTSAPPPPVAQQPLAPPAGAVVLPGPPPPAVHRPLPPPPPRSSSGQVVFELVGALGTSLGAEAAALVGAGNRLRRRASIVACSGAAAYGLVVAALWLHATGIGFAPVRFTVVALLKSWLVVPCLAHVNGWSRHRTLLVLVCFVVVTSVLGALFGSPGVALFALSTIALTSLLLLAFTHRTLRGVAPFVFVPIFLATFTLLSLPMGVWLALAPTLGVWGTNHWRWSCCLLLAASLWGTAFSVSSPSCTGAATPAIAGCCSSQWWALYAIFTGISLVFVGAVWAVAPLLGVVAYLVVVAVGWRGIRGAAAGDVPLRLLLLRPFRERGRSERLLLNAGRTWRYLGPVQLIAGRDLATASLEPHEFLDFVSGRLARRFVTDTDDLDERLATRTTHRDRDGRFRIEEYFCQDDTWRSAVHRLVGDSAAVLLDVRGFAGRDRGVAYELTTMVETFPIGSLLLVTDGSTDLDAVTHVIDQARQRIGPTSPNRDTGPLRIRLLQLGPGSSLVDPFLPALAAAAARHPGHGAEPTPAGSDAPGSVASATC
jgi:hypothetical protein